MTKEKKVTKWDQWNTKIKEIRKNLESGVDYVAIRGNDTLTKAGAEKLAFVFDISINIEMMRENQTFYFEATAVSEGKAASVGRGACTAQEKDNNINTAIKMGQKRAYVDVVIRHLGLSSLFTQDIEEHGYIKDNPKEQLQTMVNEVPPPGAPPGEVFYEPFNNDGSENCKCGKKMELKTGKSKTGKPYKQLRCPDYKWTGKEDPNHDAKFIK